mmetsp:Transcript_24403/g.52609  ORF Transcript_24403/g.52609 Transcript_24403/m.52609 type:complete len:1321 (-) Transcript_24403:368-4330(-)|eukprot:CAMPEP_0172314892 /NCGR_PEP_ID=MMETSP1058-20130122/23445_1 /TAXON_ID=83371 /ORGANISM="Detonula confervacea, Strain CCMP 353" /LENGTH=1320 /DNA_ID=CAMNT_0013028845 /DNA_START=52 /DNA_END=4014 /DNA_ORIENTATION=+
MSEEKLLLEDDDNAMFGDGDEEEEEEDEDVDMAPPPAKLAVKEEMTASTEEEKPAVDTAELNGGKVDGKVEDVDVDVPESSADAADNLPTPTPSTTAATSTMLAFSSSPLMLPTTLPQSSPFPHHNAGPTSDRLRNAMSRITANPRRDAEAWQALITEAQSCYRQLLPNLYKLKNMGHQNIKQPEDEVELIERKLDWIEACYGALLHYFPYAVTHYVQLVEFYLRLSALTQDEEEQCGSAGANLMNLMGAGGGGNATGSALSNAALATPDQGVATTPASLLMNATMANSGTSRQKLCDVKLDQIFQLCLGVTLTGSSALHGDIVTSQSITVEHCTSMTGARTIMGGLAQHSMDLWLLYIRKRSWDASRKAALQVDIPYPPPGYTPTDPLAVVGQQQVSVLHQQYEESLRSAYRERKEAVRDTIMSAYELAIDRGAGYALNNHLIWKRFVNYVKSWTDIVNYSSAALSLLSWFAPSDPNPTLTLPPVDPAHSHSSTQKQLSQLRSIYQRGITHPMTGLDQFWQEYETFERSHSESLGSVLIAEWLPRYQHARSIYLERNRVWSGRELGIGRLAVPPVGCESDGSGLGGGGVGMGLARGVGAASTLIGADDETPGTAGAGMGPKSDAELTLLLEEETRTLSKWRRRAAYERTNPERLPSSDLAGHVRASYREEICAFARHPEVWFEWSMWELLHGGSSAASTTSSAATTGGGAAGQGGSGASAALIAPAKAGEWKSGGNALRAVSILSLGMEMLPDCALLAQAQAEILERHLGGGSSGASSSSVGGKDKDGSMGGCIQVLEQFVSRSPTTLGFVLLQRLVRRHEGIAAARAVFAKARRTLRVREEDLSFDADATATSLTGAALEKKEDGVVVGSEAKEKVDAVVSSQHRMVTNRLKPSVGAGSIDKVDSQPTTVTNAGFITWHLYAAHATIEHRLGKNPQVAARIYELGLRKHRSFLSNPPYVLHYANLLLELNDEENLRSLLMRAVAACEEEEAAGAGGADAAAANARRTEMQRPLWDMMLKFESTLSSQSSKGNVSADISSIESRRRRALYGPANEDVVMGGEGPPEDEDDRNLGTGVHKSSLNEQLVRVEGYDVASRIANGLGRLVDVLTVTGAIGNGEFDATASLDFAAAATASLAAGGVSSELWGDECAGGPSDVSYVKRLKFQRESRTRAAAAALGLGGAANQGGIGASGKLLRERSTVGGGAGAQAAANALALQNSPEWLRPLLLLLPPVPKFGRGTVKPPPHLTEMALSTLRGNPLPTVRPSSSKGGTNSKKRGRNHGGGGDSSDEENGNTTGGGYSNQFRTRQRSRLVGSASK